MRSSWADRVITSVAAAKVGSIEVSEAPVFVAQQLGIGVPIDSGLRTELDELVAKMCKALKDTKRLLLLYTLRFGPRTVSELCKIIEGPRSSTSHHLAVLRDRGLVEAERRGHTVVYSLCHPSVIDAIDILRGVMSDELERQTTLRARV